MSCQPPSMHLWGGWYHGNIFREAGATQLRWVGCLLCCCHSDSAAVGLQTLFVFLHRPKNILMLMSPPEEKSDQVSFWFCCLLWLKGEDTVKFISRRIVPYKEMCHFKHALFKLPVRYCLDTQKWWNWNVLLTPALLSLTNLAYCSLMGPPESPEVAVYCCTGCVLWGLCVKQGKLIKPEWLHTACDSLEGINWNTALPNSEL